MERERSQLVISLGEGSEGQRLREVLDRAAERAGKPVSTWAREVLFAAAGDSKSEGPVDPIATVQWKNEKSGQLEVTELDVRAIAAVQEGWSHQIRALVSGSWMFLQHRNPGELAAQWRRARRWGAF